jgi:restriction system protein
MFPFHCTRCKQPLEQDETVCPKCGSTDLTVEAEARGIGMSSATARMLTRGIEEAAEKPSVTLSSLIIQERKTAEGILVQSVSAMWNEIVRCLGSDWSVAHTIPSDKWEELVAGAFKKANYDEVILTPRSGDHGRDVIAIRRGFGCVKIIGSVKAYAPGNLVSYDDVRALLGVMSGDHNVSKGIVTTTSNFPPKISDDPFIKPFLPTRLELINGAALREWLENLSRS